MGKTKIADHRNEGFTARDAMYEHNNEKGTAIHRPAITKTGLNIYSDKELEKMGGPITSYNYNEPRPWAEFKAMPRDNKWQYLSRLLHKYDGIGAVDLALMFGVNSQTVLNAFRELGIKPSPKGRSKKAAEAKARFRAEMVGQIEEPVKEPAIEEPAFLLTHASFECDAADVSSILNHLGMTGMVTITVEMI